MSRQRRPFLSDRYIFVTVKVPKPSRHLGEGDFKGIGDHPDATEAPLPVDGLTNRRRALNLAGRAGRLLIWAELEIPHRARPDRTSSSYNGSPDD